MAHGLVTFDGPNRRITEVNTGLASNELVLAAVYSEWKEWVALDPANAAIVQAFRYTGADPISDVQDTGVTYFVMNGWKLIPANYNHQLIITGNLFTDPAGEDRTDFSTITANGIEVVYNVSNLVDAAVARLDLAQLQEAVFIDTINGIPGTVDGVGTPTNPVDNIADAYTIAVRENLRGFCIIGSVVLDRTYIDWRFIGTVSKESADLDFAGYLCTRCSFADIDLTGNANGSTLFVDSCTLSTLTNALGVFKNSGLNNLFAPGTAGKITLVACHSDIPGTGMPVVDLADNLSDDLQVRGWHGSLNIKNVDVSTQKVSLDIDSGQVTLDATCTDGTIVVRGLAKLVDNSGPNCTVDRTGLVDPRDIALLRYGGIVHIDTGAAGISGSEYPAGTEEYPSNNLADALVLAANNNLRRFDVRGSLTLTAAIPDWQFFGRGEEAEINLNGQDVADSEFTDLVVTGTIGTGPVRMTACEWDGITDFSGTATGCVLRAGAHSLIGDARFIHCVSGVAGTATPIIDFNGAMGITCELRGYAGGIEIRNMTDAGNSISVDLVAGHLVTAASCTTFASGRVGGPGFHTNNSALVYNEDGLVNPTTVWKGIQLP